MTKESETELDYSLDPADDMFAEAVDEAPEQAEPAPAARPAPAAPAVLPARPAAASRLTIAACGLAAFASAAAIGSVVMAGQATAHAEAVLARAEADHARIATLPALVERFETATRRIEAQVDTRPASDATLRSGIAVLRQDLARHSAGANQGFPAMRGAQAELANRLGIVIEKLNRIDGRMERH